MTDEVRRYIISEYRRGRTYKAIAAELGITRQAISNDRRRHKEKWKKYQSLLEWDIRWGRQRILDDFIKECREWLMDLRSRREEYEAQQEAILAANPNPPPEVFRTIVKKGTEMEVALAKREVKLYFLLSKTLAERYDLS